MNKRAVFAFCTALVGTPLVGTALAACGGGGAAEGAEEPEASSGETATESSGSGGEGKESAAELLGITGPDQPWAEMSHEDKEWYMVGKVMPIMKEQFQAHDSEEFADFACETCHGPDGKERDWEMPSTHLPPIYPAGHPKAKEMSEKHGDIMAFMATDVTPTMTTLLGMEPLNPETGKGFGCVGCHPAGE